MSTAYSPRGFKRVMAACDCCYREGVVQALIREDPNKVENVNVQTKSLRCFDCRVRCTQNLSGHCNVLDGMLDAG